MEGTGDPELLAALRAVGAEPSPENRRRVFERLLAGTLVLPLAEAAGEPGQEVIALEREEAPPALIAFTGAEALALWGPVPRAGPVQSRELMAFAAAHGFRRLVVDPAGPVSAELTRDEIESLAAGEVPDGRAASDEDEPDVLGPLAAPVAEDFVAGLRRSLAAAEGVSAGWLFEATPLDGARRLVIGLELDDPGAGEAVIEGMREELSELAPARVHVDWTVVRRDDTLASLSERAGPLYER